jgi:hypothetical protein
MEAVLSVQMADIDLHVAENVTGLASSSNLGFDH